MIKNKTNKTKQKKQEQQEKVLLWKQGIKGSLFNVINGIHEKPTTKIKLNGERLKAFSLRSGAKQDAYFHHCYSTLYWSSRQEN